MPPCLRKYVFYIALTLSCLSVALYVLVRMVKRGFMQVYVAAKANDIAGLQVLQSPLSSADQS